MGRNKIDIKPLEDGRNRTVTFTKRKAGLFKKAHELAILCSVDISVIIIGRNKKIYEYCSNDSNEILNLYQSDQMNMFESKNPKDYGDYESKSRIPPIRNSHGSNRHRPSNSLNEIRERHRLENNHTRTASDTTQLRNRTRSARGNPIRDVNETIDESQINYDEMEDADHFEDEEGSNDVDDSDGDSNGVEEDLETEDRNLNLGSKRRMPFQSGNHVNKLIKPEKRSPLDIRIPPIEPHTPEPSSAQYYNDQTPKLTPYKPLSSLKKAGNSKRPTLSLQIPHNGADDSLSRSNQSTITAGNSSNKSNQSVHNKSNEKQGNGTDVDNSKGNNLNISVISNGSENSSNNNNSTTLNMISLKNDENIHTTLPSPKDILSGINIKNQFNMLANNRGRNNLNDGSSTPLTSALRKAFTPTTTNFLNNFNINNSALETPLGGGFNFSTMSPQLTTPAIGFPTLHNHQTDLQQAQTQQQLKQQPASQPQNQLNHLQSQNGLMMGNNQHNSQQQEEQRQQPNQDNRDRSHMVNLTPMNRNSATSTFYPPFPSNLQRGISYMNGIGTSGISNTIGNINSSNNIMNISEPPRVGEMPSKYPDNKTPDTSLFPAEWTMNTGLTPVLQIRPTFPIIRSSGSNMNNIKKATTEDETSLKDTSNSKSSKN